ncbi:NAD(P)H-hydrate dehydratase [Endozoicomonas euniceicola]|uniref:Bifunctional NAD(P)H-hydrate repair enzyme n=1 Tax=Endozoicomonas euniceicola TaxID=1234143 RepID=A0ABY6H0V6_9GAMM|nr:NAD(P)H-hydrate dehydratase [Endozoicomonas euniceicola]UYM17906.1 NAD(P)H-hydrate dehydratase [Endozoicomonas euniceicola]
MRRLPQQLYTAEQVRQLDRLAIGGVADHPGIDGFELMGRAADAAFSRLLQSYPQLDQDAGMQVFCGAGNNGGDGYLIAALASERRISVSVTALKHPDELTGDARKAFEYCSSKGIRIALWCDESAVTGEILVDAMLGTGLSGEVRGDYRRAIEALNHSGKPVVAVDIPSGLCADTGAVLGAAVQAELTVTFIGTKQGLLTGDGPQLCGTLHFTDLDVPAVVYNRLKPSSIRLDKSALKELMAPRKRTAHKGDYGHVLIIGGNHGMPGAVIMAAEAAISCGAGKVTVATRPEHLPALAIRRPEVMAVGVGSRVDLQSLLHDKTVIVAGPGIGTDSWAYDLVDEALNADVPVVLDADALNLLSEHSQLRRARKFPMMLTPHPGEAARLLKTDTGSVQKDRFAAVASLSATYNACVVLKGAGSLIQYEQQTSLCSAGNPGMAVAGMGDVLSGVIGALLAQNLPVYDAARLGVWLHASGADTLAWQQGETGLLATDTIPFIRQQLNELTGQAVKNRGSIVADDAQSYARKSDAETCT